MDVGRNPQPFNGLAFVIRHGSPDVAERLIGEGAVHKCKGIASAAGDSEPDSGDVAIVNGDGYIRPGVRVFVPLDQALARERSRRDEPVGSFGDLEGEGPIGFGMTDVLRSPRLSVPLQAD